jgi:hypothetical protein
MTCEFCGEQTLLRSPDDEWLGEGSDTPADFIGGQDDEDEGDFALDEYDMDSLDTFRVASGTLHMTGHGHLWTKEAVYDVAEGKRTVVNLEALLPPAEGDDDSGGELLIGFSQNRMPWGSNQEDALTLRLCSTSDWPTAVRARMYNDFVMTSDFRPETDVWLNVRIELTNRELIAYVDGEQVISADLTGHSFPLQGHVGLLAYNARDVCVDSLLVSVE